MKIHTALYYSIAPSFFSPLQIRLSLFYLPLSPSPLFILSDSFQESVLPFKPLPSRVVQEPPGYEQSAATARKNNRTAGSGNG